MKTKYMRDSLFYNRIEKLINCLNYNRYSENIPIINLSWGECILPQDLTSSFSDEKVIYKNLNPGFIFSGYDKYWWVKVNDLIIPDWKNKNIIIKILFEKQTDEWDKGTEGLVILNGKPWQGIDQNHLEIYLPQDSIGKNLDLKIRYWTGANNHDIKHHKFHSASLLVLNPICDKLYFIVKNMFNAIKLANKDSFEAVVLEKSLDKIYKIIDINDCSEHQLQKSLEIAQASLASIEVKDLPSVDIIGHTHIDVAWQWRFKHTREKSLRSFSTVMRLMDLYPEYKFLQSTPQLYEYIREDFPELFENIKNKILEKRWECEGGMWVEADCNIPNGESLVRQFIYGKNYFRKMFNYDSKILWLPDVFGFNWSLPQIMKKSGIEYFMTTKLSWNQYNKIPNETFIWKGIDGSEILTHFINTPEEGLSEDNIFRTYNGMVSPFTIKKMWEDYTNKELNSTLLNCYGYGDGGGGVNREMLENSRVLNNLPSIPKTKQNFAIDFFNNLKDTVQKNKDYLNIIDGELYFELHRGTYTSQAFIKKENRTLEYKLRNLEILSIFKSIKENGFNWFNEDLFHKNYQQFLTNQFHDIIPGTSIKEVYDDVKKFNSNFNKYLDNEILNIVKNNHEDDSYTLINLNDCHFNQFIFISKEENGYFTFEGKKLLSSYSNKKHKVSVSIPPFSSINIKFIKSFSIDNNKPFLFIDNTLETPYYKVKFINGIISNLYDKINDREISKGNLGQLVLFEDIPEFWDSWDIELHHKYKNNHLIPKSFKLKSIDELQIVFLVEYDILGLKLNQEIIFYVNSPLIDFKTNANYTARQKLLKVYFDVDIRSNEATYDIQFGNIKRSTTSNNDWQMAQFECVAHRFVDISDNAFGVALLNNCKYGHIVKDNRIELTLIKGGIFPDKSADIGLHSFNYALYPHLNNFVYSDVISVAENYNNLPLIVNGNFNFNLPVFIKNKNIAFSCIKKSIKNNDFIVRLYENQGSKTTVDLSSLFPEHLITLCNLLEDDIRPINENERKKFIFNPFEIHSFRIVKRS